MQRIFRLLAGHVPLVAACCASPVPEPPAQSAPDAAPDVTDNVQVVPPSDPQRAPTVLRFHVPVSRVVDSSEVRLFEGELSDYHLRRIADRDLPQTLLEREVPVRRWRHDSTWVVAPLRALEEGVHELAAPAGVLLRLGVAPEALPMLERVWPPAFDDSAETPIETAATHLIYCGPEASAVQAPRQLSLGPKERAATLTRGLGSFQIAATQCLQLLPLTPLDSGAELVVPPELDGVLLQPGLLKHAPPLAEPALSCDSTELDLALGCLRVEDDRAVVRAGSRSWWVFEHADGASWFELGARQSQLLEGLVPGTQQELKVFAVDAAGQRTERHLTLRTAQPICRLVINEVYANPIGQEPQQEWIEVANASPIPCDLGQWALRDAGGELALPTQLVEPGELILLVGPGFDRSGSYDPLPEPSTRLVELAELGTNGLSNAGEPLELLHLPSQRRSAFPPSPKPKAGVSIARRHPTTLDTSVADFSHHAPPGASPGGKNQLAEQN